MRVKIAAGADVDIATPAEVSHLIGKGHESWFQEMARGVKQMRFFGDAIVAADATLALPGPGPAPIMGPETGFTWVVRRLSVYGVEKAGAELLLWRNSTDGSQFIAPILMSTATMTATLQFEDRAVVLGGGEQLLITGTSLTAGKNVMVNGEATEVPSFMAWKLLAQ